MLTKTRDPELFDALLASALQQFYTLTSKERQAAAIRAKYRPQLDRCRREIIRTKRAMMRDGKGYAVMGWADWHMEQKLIIAPRDRELAELFSPPARATRDEAR